MGVFTVVDRESLADFLESYDIGALLSFSGIRQGVENTNYVLHTSYAKYILTLYEKRTNEKDLPWFLQLMTWLRRKGVCCPHPLADRSGEVVGCLEGKKAAIFPFLEGSSQPSPSVGDCALLGRALAELHVIGCDFPNPRRNHCRNHLGIGFFSSLLRLVIGEEAASLHPGLNEFLVREMTHLQQHFPLDLPKGVIHGDLFPDNVFFHCGEISAMIDFYFACWDFLAWDLAICMNAWCFDSQGCFDVLRSRSLLRAYMLVRPLQTSEVEALPVLCRGAGLRFLLTRLHDWLHGDRSAFVSFKDPLAFLPVIRFHRRIQDGGLTYGLR